MAQRLMLQVERERQGRTRANVARAAGINNTTYGWAELQRYRLLDSQLVKVARALGWPVEDRTALLDVADMTSETPRLLVRIEDAARQLSIGRTTVYKLAGDGQLQLVKIGRRSLVTAESLERFVTMLSACGPDSLESKSSVGSS